MIELNYKEYGSGDNNLIILHGFLGSLDNWHSLATDWGNNGLHVYVVDQRNHGKSPHTSAHSIPLMVDDVKDFMTQHNITKSNIMGHSMGGKVAMQFALTYPLLTHKLIVVDMAPKPYRNGAHDDVFKAINNVDLSKAQTRKEAEHAMAEYLGDFGTRQFIMKGLDRVDEAHYKWKFNIDVLKRDYINILQETYSNNHFLGEALFIHGGNSLYVQQKDLPAIHKLFPHYKLVTVEDAGHWLHADKPKVVFEEIIRFLE
jgi:pimeloyl-ACP methyl ester carboxylesterase